jgi:predicted alpha/beta hydrolase
MAPNALTRPLTTSDGYVIETTLYRADRDPKARIVIAGATGVPQAFYRRFAEFMVSHNYEVMTLDYRGVGLSAPPKLKGFKADFLDWAQYDLAAAIEFTRDQGGPVYVVGHSYGGHALGLLPEQIKVDAAYLFGTGAGWHGHMPRLEQVKVLWLWKVLGPILTAIYGYLPMKMMRMGEDVPLEVYRQWRRWCQFPNYFFGDPKRPEMKAKFARVKTPMIFFNTTDDLWAPPKSRDAFIASYSQATIIRVDFNPDDHKLKPIGHMGYFRKSSQGLWPNVVDWFDNQPRPNE